MLRQISLAFSREIRRENSPQFPKRDFGGNWGDKVHAPVHIRGQADWHRSRMWHEEERHERMTQQHEAATSERYRHGYPHRR